jgi:hypothetical protein
MKNPAFLLNLSSGSVRTVEDEPEDPEALAAFYTFAVIPDEGTNSITLRVRAKAKTSMRREFTVVVLRDCAQ